MISTFLEAIIAPSRPVGNRIIHITVSGLVAIDGSTLNGPVTSYFTTALSPFHSNIMRIRLLAGEFLVDVPDFTIDQLIQYYSRQADLYNFSPQFSLLSPNTYASYRSRWVSASIIVSLLSGTSVNSMLQKRLGDLSVKRDRAAEELFKFQTDELRKLTGILQDGGLYGRSLETAIKGVYHPETPVIGRMWTNSESYPRSEVPLANTRTYNNRSFRRYERTYRDKVR